MPTMRLAKRLGYDVRLEDAPVPAPGPGQIRLRVLACGVCGTDIHLNPDDKNFAPFGHEIVGRVVEQGAGVTFPKVGDVVALDSATPCGWCANCRDARQELCTDIQSFFMLNSFGFAEEMIAPAISALPAGDLDPAVATLQEPLGVAYDLFRLSDITIHSNVLVMGPGAIGLMAARLARVAGARRVYVAGVARDPVRLAMAKRFSADDVIDLSKTKLSDFRFDGEVDRVMVTSPPATLASAFDVACKGGIVSYIGIAHGDGAFCRFEANAFHFKKLQLRASFASPAQFGGVTMRLIREGVVDAAALVTHRFPLERLDEAVKTAATSPDAIKVVMVNA